MFLLEIVGGIIAFLFARATWHFVCVRAKAMNELPLVWLAKTSMLVAAFCGIVGFFIAGLLFCLAEIAARGGRL